MDRRVRVITRNRRKRLAIYIGTFKAYDKHVNVILSDVYRVVKYNTADQRVDLEGLLFLMGTSVVTVTLESKEKTLHPFPTKVKKVKKKRKKKKQPAQVSASTIVPTKPLKLKRTWLTSENTTSENPDSRQPLKQKLTNTPDEANKEYPREVKREKEEEKREVKQKKAEIEMKDTKQASPRDDVQIKLEEFESEIILKEEPKEPSFPTFEEFLLARRNNEVTEDVKSEVASVTSEGEVSTSS